jgi:hypothetical protein
MHVRKGVAEGGAMAAAAVAVAVTHGIYAVHPWQGSTPLDQFLAAFGRADTAAWPMLIVLYLVAVAMVGLALWPARRWSSPLICALAAAYFAWIGIGYFAWLMPGTGLSGVWAGAVHAAGAAAGSGGYRAQGPGDPASAGPVLEAGCCVHGLRADRVPARWGARRARA